MLATTLARLAFWQGMAQFQHPCQKDHAVNCCAHARAMCAERIVCKPLSSFRAFVSDSTSPCIPPCIPPKRDFKGLLMSETDLRDLQRGAVHQVNYRTNRTCGRRFETWGAWKATGIHLKLSAMWCFGCSPEALRQAYDAIYTDAIR